MKVYLDLVKFSHTIFAMPFAMVGFFFGWTVIQTSFPTGILVPVIICMISARNTAMAFNRYLDRDIDSLNPRTVQREIPSGKISLNKVIGFIVINMLVFVISAGYINTLCLILSPIALTIIMGYSYTKRTTALCHYVLGIGLALAPVGAYIAVTNDIDISIILLGLAVMFWVAGFDIIYALQDSEFDVQNNLNSIPAKYGIQKALLISRGTHIVSFLALCSSTALFYNHGWVHGAVPMAGLAIFSILLVYQHAIVSANNLSKVNMAFFTTNGFASIIFGVLMIISIF